MLYSFVIVNKAHEKMKSANFNFLFLVCLHSAGSSLVATEEATLKGRIDASKQVETPQPNEMPIL